MMRRQAPTLLALAALLTLAACEPKPEQTSRATPPGETPQTTAPASSGATTTRTGNAALKAARPAPAANGEPRHGAPTPAPPTGFAHATFAGGCFWCMEPPFEKLEGVRWVVSGFAGGREDNPTYKQVAYGKTTHIESVQITYDPKKISYEKLLDVFWRNVNPTQANGQFVDIGPHYRTVIFAHNNDQLAAAKKSKAALEKSGVFSKPIVTEIRDFSTGKYWPAEDYHQDFYKKSPLRYKSYRRGSGRDDFIQKTWGDR